MDISEVMSEGKELQEHTWGNLIDLGIGLFLGLAVSAALAFLIWIFLNLRHKRNAQKELQGFYDQIQQREADYQSFKDKDRFDGLDNEDAEEFGHSF